MSNLNKAQTEAVNTLSGPVLILAGAGAGKTKTIVERIANLIKNGASPSSILAVTFTNKAAGEMRERVIRILRDDPLLKLSISRNEIPYVSTFHSLAAFLIRENSKAVGLPKHFKIYDQSDSRQAIKEAIKEEGLEPKEFEPARLLSIISREKGDGVWQKQYETEVLDDYFGRIVAAVWRRYESKLRNEKALDFDDLLLFALRLLENSNIRAVYNSRFRHVHIDEYQDTNVVQYRIANLLAAGDKNICVVGDIDQNIYSWRGARLKNILDFEKDYPNVKVILLEENYRSTQNILAAANAVIEKNEFRKKKTLYTKNPLGENISLYEGFDEMSEAEFIASKAKGLVEGGIEESEIAILYRANFQSRALEEAFLSYGVKYQIIGTRFFERKEVKDVLAYLRLILNPESLSDLKRAINAPARGIGKVAFLKIIEGKSEELPRGARVAYDKFNSLIEKARTLLESEKISAVLKLIIKESGLEESLLDGTEESEERLLNVQELVTIASRYNHLGGIDGAEELLTNASLQSDQDELAEAKSGVKLMTVHSAKGLEFDYVFVCGLESGLFPHERIVPDKKNEDDEEERRLFYVALTRARKKIFLSYCQTRTIYGSRQVNLPSEFIYDIPENLLIREEGTYGLLRKPLRNIQF